jgi:tetratricopeptide (TPR) repeat protein
MSKPASSPGGSNALSSAQSHARATTPALFSTSRPPSIDAAPWLPIPHAALAEARTGRRVRRDEALESAKRAIELDPDETLGYSVAGTVEMAYGNWKEAEGWYRRALEVDPGHPDRAGEHGVRQGTGELGPALLVPTRCSCSTRRTRTRAERRTRSSPRCNGWISGFFS